MKRTKESRSLEEAVDSIFMGLPLRRQSPVTTMNDVKGGYWRQPADTLVSVRKDNIDVVSAPIINVKDIEGGLLPARSALQAIQIRENSHMQHFRLQIGDVLVSARGLLKVAGVTENQAGAIAGGNIIVVRPGKVLAAPLILAFLRHPSTRETLERNSASTTVASINVQTVSRLRLIIPSLEKQKELSRLVELADEQYLVALHAAEIRRQIGQEIAMRALAV